MAWEFNLLDQIQQHLANDFLNRSGSPHLLSWRCGTDLDCAVHSAASFSENKEGGIGFRHCSAFHADHR